MNYVRTFGNGKKIRNYFKEKCRNEIDFLYLVLYKAISGIVKQSLF